jgi:hypothetical protein
MKCLVTKGWAIRRHWPAKTISKCYTNQQPSCANFVSLIGSFQRSSGSWAIIDATQHSQTYREDSTSSAVAYLRATLASKALFSAHALSTKVFLGIFPLFFCTESCMCVCIWQLIIRWRGSFMQCRSSRFSLSWSRDLSFTAHSISALSSRR